MLEAVEETAGWTTAKIKAIRELAEHTRTYVRGTLPKIYSQELIDVIFAQPYCRISNLDEALAEAALDADSTRSPGSINRLSIPW